jgi:predicted DNA-binding transcriptional regulator AlpA
MSPVELAAFLGDEFPEKTLANWRSQGSGPKFLKIGRHVRYRPADVETWLVTRERAPEAA